MEFDADAQVIAGRGEGVTWARICSFKDEEYLELQFKDDGTFTVYEGSTNASESGYDILADGRVRHFEKEEN